MATTGNSLVFFVFFQCLNEKKSSLEAALKASKETASAEAGAAAGLRKELKARPTVSEVKALRQQLRVLQQLEFNANNDGEDDEVGFTLVCSCCRSLVVAGVSCRFCVFFFLTE